jgi:hypothetical protein
MIDRVPREIICQCCGNTNLSNVARCEYCDVRLKEVDIDVILDEFTTQWNEYIKQRVLHPDSITDTPPKFPPYGVTLKEIEQYYQESQPSKTLAKIRRTQIAWYKPEN